MDCRMYLQNRVGEMSKVQEMKLLLHYANFERRYLLLLFRPCHMAAPWRAIFRA